MERHEVKNAQQVFIFDIHINELDFLGLLILLSL